MSKAVTVVDEVRGALQAMSPQFKAALPPHVSPEKFLRVIMTAVQQTPALLSADRTSLYSACMRAAQDGLLPDGREGAIVTFNSKNGVMAQWMPMAAGLMKKVRNSGEISTWSLQIVKENDHFDYQLGDKESIEHKPAIAKRGKTIGAYSIVSLKDGEKSREFMNLEEIEAIRSRSKSKDSGPWATDHDEMCKKTVARRHSKRLPMSTDLEDFIHQDDVLINLDKPEAPPVEPKAKSTRLSKIVNAQTPNNTETQPPIDAEYVDSAPVMDSDEEIPI